MLWFEKKERPKIDTESRIIEQTEKYIFVSFYAEHGLYLKDIEKIESEFSGEYVDSQYLPLSHRIQILLRKVGA